MIVFAIVAVTMAAPAVAGDSKQNAPKKPHLICKRDLHATGTRMSPLVCKTADQWDAMNEAGDGKLGTMAHGQPQGSGQSSFPSN
jgi:hypothetical protein